MITSIAQVVIVVVLPTCSSPSCDDAFHPGARLRFRALTEVLERLLETLHLLARFLEVLLERRSQFVAGRLPASFRGSLWSTASLRQ
jgi:hypothetical protein